MAKIKFLADSSADIPKKYIDELGIQVMHFPIIIGEREIYDGVDYSNEDFYDLLLSLPDIPSHAQLNPVQFEEVYEDAYRDGYDAVVYGSINFKGSATGNNAVMARETFFEEHPDAKGKFEIYVVDSHGYTFQIGYPIVQAARKAIAEDISGAEAAEILRDWYDNSKILFACYDLKFARKSGRISAAAAIVGSALGIKPIMSFPDGESKVLAKVRGDKTVVPTLVDLALKEMEPGTDYLIVNGSLQDHNKEIQEAAEVAVGCPAFEAFKIGGVISVNAGPAVVGIIYREKAN